MKTTKTIVFSVVIAVILTLAWLNRSKTPSNNGSSASAILSGLNQYDASKIKGDYLLIHFWAKWCEPCAEEIPQLVEFAASPQFPARLKVIAVSLDPSLEEAKKILPHQGANLPSAFLLYLDPEHQVAEKFGSFQYPETYFVDPGGKILEKWIGPQKWLKPEVAQFFKQRIQQ